jgi:hypothetical protein
VRREPDPDRQRLPFTQADPQTAVVEVLVLSAGDPIPGLYRIRLVKGGPYVAARIEYGPPADPIDDTPLDRAPRWQCWIDGEMIGADRDPHKAGAYRIWPAHQISQDDYDHMLAISKWARENSPRDPAANPSRPIDLMTTPVPF